MTVPELEYEVPTWNKIYSILIDQGNRICESGFNPDVIVGVSRGGLIPARILSDLLENTNIANVKAESYIGIGKVRSEPKITQCLSVNVSGKSVLVVDEIADSGRSIKLIARHVLEKGGREVRTATMYCKPHCVFKPDYFEVDTSCWVVFPWEIRETLCRIMDTSKASVLQTRREVDKLAESGVPKILIARFLKKISAAKPC